MSNKLEILTVKPNTVFTYGCRAKFSAGKYILFRAKPTDPKIASVFSPTYAQYRSGAKIGWIAKLENWMVKATNKTEKPLNLATSDLSEVLGCDINTRRKWQRDALSRIVGEIEKTGGFKGGVVAPLGAGKCLFGLDICQLGDKALYLAPTYLHGQIIQEAEKFNRVCPTISTYESAHKFEHIEFDVIVPDECTKIKNPDSDRTQKFRRLAKKAPIVVGLTGTPQSSREGLDLRWINSIVPEAMPDKDKQVQYLFGLNPQEKIITFVCGVDDDGYEMTGKATIVEVEGWDTQALADFLHDEIFFVDITELYAEIPGIQYRDILLARPKYFPLALNGLLTESEETAERKSLAQARQTTSGFYYDDEQNPIRTSKEKVTYIKQWLEDNPNESLVVYSTYVEAQRILSEELEEYQPALVLKESSDLAGEIDKFKNKETRLMIVSTAYSYGMNLMGVCWNLMFESLPTNSEAFQQCIGRVYRPGQQNFVNIYFLLCENTLDSKSKELLMQHASVSDAVVEEGLKNELRRLRAIEKLNAR